MAANRARGREPGLPNAQDSRQIMLEGYAGQICQLAILDLGHEEPTILLTNQLQRSPRHADRALRPANGHWEQHCRSDQLLPHGRLVVSRRHEGQLRPPALMACSFYRLLGTKVGNGYAQAKADHIFRDHVDATTLVTLTPPGDPGALPEAGAQSVAPRSGPRHLRHSSAMAPSQETPAQFWRVTRALGRCGAWDPG